SRRGRRTVPWCGSRARSLAGSPRPASPTRGASPSAEPPPRPGSTSRSETPGVGADRRPVGETPEKQWRTPARAISARLAPTRAEEHPRMRLAARSAHIVAAALALACGVPWMLAPRTADASPPPSMRSHPVPSASSAARPGLADEGRGRFAACGTRLESAVDMLLAHDARVEGAPLPTPNSTDAGEIAVLEDDGTFFYTDKNGNQILDLVSAARAFYRTHGDDYD